MSKSGVSKEKEKKKDEEGSDNNPPVQTRLTRNRLLFQRQQKASTEGPDDSKPGRNTVTSAKTKPEEDDGGSKDRPSSSSVVDNEKEAKPQPAGPQSLLDKKTKPADPSVNVPIMRPRRGVEKDKRAKTPAKDSKNENGTEKSVFAMKTRSTRSSNQASVNTTAASLSAKATTQQKKESDENAKNLQKKKRVIPSYRRTKKMYDEAGALLANGKDYCDCLELDCPGCHFPCKKCGSEKCGTECRCDRIWVYDEVKVEGTGVIIKNHAC